MPKVSVIVPVYNTEKYLPKCLDSLTGQTLSDIEIICINDCSTDNSLSVLQEYAKKDNRIKIIEFKENKGVSIARNTGIDAATGEYIGFVDSDDFIDPDFYEKLYTKAKETGADVVKGNITEYGNDLENKIFHDLQRQINTNKIYFHCQFTSAIYSTSFLKNNHIYFLKGTNLGEDRIVPVKSAILSNVFCVVNSTFYHYDRHSDSLTGNWQNANKINQLLTSTIQITDYLKNEQKLSCKNRTFLISLFFTEFIRALLEGLRKDLSGYNFAGIQDLLKLEKHLDQSAQKLKNIIQNYVINKDVNQISREIQLLEKTALLAQLRDNVKKAKNALTKEEKILSAYKEFDYLNNDTSNPLIKILVSYIKPSFLFKSKILTPIHLGKAVERLDSKDGVQSDEKLKWLHENCEFNDDFDGGISIQNRRIGFLTGTYWAWKNYDKLGTPKYFGSFGYRKLLSADFIDQLGTVDIVVPETTIFKDTLKQQFIDSHGSEMYQTMIHLLKVNHPEDLALFNTCFEQKEGYFHELYVMKNDIFFDFCEWIFKMLFSALNDFESKILNVNEFNKRFCKTFDVSPKELDAKLGIDSEKEVRDLAFIFERLTGFYLYKLIQDKKIKYTTASIVRFDKQQEDLQTLILEKIHQKIKKRLEQKK